MDKVQVVILGISATPGGNAFALILKELDGNRRLPIIIGAFEAQSIAFELEGVNPPRPLTHDLIKIMLDTFGYQLSEIFIDSLEEGTFHAKLIFEVEGIQIDCRPSDAIAIAIRVNAPIYVNSEILEEAGVSPLQNDPEMQMPNFQQPSQKAESTPSSGNKRLDILQSQLEKAIKEENYETAAKLRDEIKKILESS
ncbi:MAG: bifunctional nuclease domain-containing protein [Candidatus Kapaibacteriota bacterium]